jgi:hypothetical protein
MIKTAWGGPSRCRPGWLLYASPEIGPGLVLSGEVLRFELAAEHSWAAASYRVTCELAPGAVPRHDGPLEAAMWQALQSWPQPGSKDGRRWPAEMEALLALARNHPEEYERLRDGEAVLRALGG